jgi:hypothetical protein
MRAPRRQRGQKVLRLHLLGDCLGSQLGQEVISKQQPLLHRLMARHWTLAALEMHSMISPLALQKQLEPYSHQTHFLEFKKTTFDS